MKRCRGDCYDLTLRRRSGARPCVDCLALLVRRLATISADARDAKAKRRVVPL